MQPKSKLAKLSVMSLVLITVGSVDSVRNLPATALFGSGLIFYFLVAALLFLLPCALVSAELSSTSPDHGGVYAWVKQAFGPRWGFLAVWFQWTENFIWYPTILSFIAGTIGYLISPEWAHSRGFIITVILIAFWGATLINLFGIKSSAWFGNFTAIAGLLIPMVLIIALGVLWFLLGKPMQIVFDSAHILPHEQNADMWVALTGIVMSFCGMEIATVHSSDVLNPQRDFPRAMLISVLILLLTLMAGGLSIAMVVPAHEMSLVSGIMQAFHVFFGYYHLTWILPLIALMLVIGGAGGVSNWIIAPTRGMQIAAMDGNLPTICQKENRYGAPWVLLLVQAVLSTLMTMAFLLMPSINGAYWLLTALAAQQYMLMYVLMFLAAIRWRFLKLPFEKGYRIPGGQWGIIAVALVGLLAAIGTFLIGFVPPDNIAVGSMLRYESFLVGGLVVMCTVPFFLKRRRHPVV